MTCMDRLIAAACLLAASFAVTAGEAEVRRMTQDKVSADRIQSIEKVPWGELFEVVVRGPDGPQIFYVDAEAKVIIVGQAIDARSGRNLTESRKRELTRVKWESLPLQWAITSQRGSGRRKIAILSDPNCPYCKRFEEDLAKLDDISVHILPWAVVQAESVRQAKSVWCSKDRVKAWNDLMFRRIEPQARTDCDNPIDEIIAYGRTLGANSTPTWFLENGERYSGAVPFEELQALLDQASPKR